MAASNNIGFTAQQAMPLNLLRSKQCLSIYCAASNASQFTAQQAMPLNLEYLY
jgi:hypothetical protein